MRKEQRFFKCKECGNVVGLVVDAGVNVDCCGGKMVELIPNTTEAAVEKHLPVVEVIGDVVKVNVGSVDHPMIPEHYIEWIYIETEKGGQRKNLSPGEEPRAVFVLKDDKVLAVYEYCNLHGLWKTAVK
ncbi:MAG TPA: desulfoferrodoxin [Clostridiales bacterium]|nr:desulfoferrodoxin [Clostridiales bacterium]